ncbi:MAG: hypothetical protein MUE49_01935 [Rhodospirillales bacterium]|jgi:zinc transporter|nr:hypothetical protein [Rhodospirillales bacterium]
MGTELLDNKGLICGFLLPPAGPAISIGMDGVDALAPPSTPVWLNFNINDSRARDWLATCGWLNEEGRETLLSKHHNIRFEAYGASLAGVLADVYADEPDAYGVFHLFADAHGLITARRHPLTAAARLHQDLVNGVSVDGSRDALQRLLGYIAESFDRTVLAYAERIDDAEEAVFAGHIAQLNLGQHRREMARLRRHVFANRHAVVQVSQDLPSAQVAPIVKGLQRLAAALTQISQDLELVEERARLVSEEIDSLLAARTNRNLYFVSLAAVVFLPITVISGIFGMNVAGLPWTEDEHGFINAIVLMLIAVVVAGALIRWRRMW